MNSNLSGAAEMLDSEQAAARIGKSKSWLETQRSKGRGPRFVRVGASIRYRPADLDAYLAGSVVETADSRQQAARSGRAAA